ncbi:DUF4129 domain-containing protein [Mucilaginibacter sp.]|uniref:DUF4129 domain-containing protein n=1 Tax=Mucilaginibacter sp. TaxID=1882438 RepID=UPI00262BC44A|nr:DUF4129 domain-containing protein [Mucilaginibacter sp.]
MKKFIPSFFLTAMLLSFSFTAAPATVKKIQAKVHTDTSKIQVKKFDEQALKRFKADKDFNYNSTAIGAGQPSLWDRFWNWLWNKITAWFEGVPYSGQVFKYLLLAMSVTLVIYVIIKSVGIEPGRLWRGEAAKTSLPYSESLENIHEINFDAEIEKAIAQHNYRLAVRLLYLKCLKQLSDENLIKWQINKTNSAYLYELTNPRQKQIFGLLTRQFEYVWYGNFAISKQAFANIDLLFQDFKKQLP